MKNLLMIVLLFSSVSFAQTQMTITPSIPVRCADQDYLWVNHIVSQEKVSETPDFVTYHVVTQELTCKNKIGIPLPLDKGLILFEINKSQGWIWQKEPVRYSYTMNDNKNIELDLTFEKAKIFGKLQEQGKPLIMDFNMTFYPEGAFDRYYLWYIELTNSDSNEASLKIHIN